MDTQLRVSPVFEPCEGPIAKDAWHDECDLSECAASSIDSTRSDQNGSSKELFVKIKVRVDLSGARKYVGLVFYVAVLGGIFLAPLVAETENVETENSDGLRRTSRGWEHAHAVQINPSKRGSSAAKVIRTPTNGLQGRAGARNAWTVWHSYALPLAAGSFFVSFGWWLLVDIPNRGIVRRLS